MGHRTRNLKHAIAFGFVFLCLGRSCAATSIVVLITPNVIVIGADWQIAVRNGAGQSLPGTRGRKIAAFHHRIVLASAGSLTIGANGYTLHDVFSSMADTDPAIAVSGFVEALRTYLTQKFQDFDLVLKTGKIKAEALPPPHDTLLEFLIVGFEDDAPKEYSVKLKIDWTALHLQDPIVTMLYPNDRKNFYLDAIGDPQRGIGELTDFEGELYKTTFQEMPGELEAWRFDRPLHVDSVRPFACALLNIEVSRNGAKSGYPLTIITVPKVGGLKEDNYQENCEHVTKQKR